MSTITKQWLQQAINDYESVRDEIPFGLDEYQGNILAALRIALASLEAEPVCHLTWHQGFRAPDDCEEYVVEAKPGDKSCDGSPAFPVYAAPPAPVSVPTFDEWLEIRGNKPLGWVKDAMRESYEACRAAMLQGADSNSPAQSDCCPEQNYIAPAQDGDSPVIPDGWVMVPVEPTEDMIVNGFESEPDESFSDEREWEAYDAMSGCQQAAHRAKLCWAAMITAAPKPDVR
ncbi:DUF551 domain-containing protein [Enterobacter roggenkampii]|uniref:DUF551 domain-containing protein n=1 Tax=Enterobacter roggenkampii TaxID=1812935 RepID=UPI002074BD2E|nr:DUF551 domain-containing protein [Enterobacter roggenkampii]MCM7075837.1 DUF551 domain-containing protein [Enterobacter roggenkampii]